MEKTIKEIALEGAKQALPQILQMLEQICNVDSGTENEAGNQQVIALLRPLFARLGAEVEEVYEQGLGTHLIVRVLPKEQPKGKMLLMAHLDTVFPVGSAAEHPFHIKDDWAWGLGVVDCKCGVLISLFSALILKEADLLPSWNFTYIFNCDEEIGSGSGCKLFEQEAKDADCALVFEGGREVDGKLHFVTARRGVILGDIDVKGKEAHAGSAYLEGHSAVHELAQQIVRLYSFNDMEKKIYYNVAPISGGRPNGVVAGQAHGQFCVAGLPTNADFKVVEEKLASMPKQITVEGCTVDVTWKTLFPAMERTEKSGKLYDCVKEAASVLGLETEEVADPCATDAAWISSFGVPAIDALSAIELDIHTMEERVYIPSIEQRTALGALTIYAVCQKFKV